MLWFAIAVGGALGSTTRHRGRPALERMLPAAACRQLWDHRVDGFLAGVLLGVGLQIPVAVKPAASLALLAAFAVASTMPSAGGPSLAMRLARGVMAAAAGLAIGTAL